MDRISAKGNGNIDAMRRVGQLHIVEWSRFPDEERIPVVLRRGLL